MNDIRAGDIGWANGCRLPKMSDRLTSTPAFIAHVDLYPRVRPFETIALTDCPKARSLSD